MLPGRSPKTTSTACDADAAYAALADFSGTPLGKKYPAAVAVWERAWDRFILLLEYGPALRKVLYTMNAIESFNREMRKVLKTRTQFPNDDSVAKTLDGSPSDLLPHSETRPDRTYSSTPG